MTIALLLILAYGSLGMAGLSWAGVLPSSALAQMRRARPELDDMARLRPALLAFVLAVISFVSLALWPFALGWELYDNGWPRN